MAQSSFMSFPLPMPDRRKGGGRQWASGTATASTTTDNFTYVAGGANVKNFITVSGLTFKPSLIYIMRFSSTTTEISLYSELSGDAYPKPVKVTSFNTTTQGSNAYHFRGDVAPANVSVTGFTLPVTNTNVVFTWLAIE